MFTLLVFLFFPFFCNSQIFCDNVLKSSVTSGSAFIFSGGLNIFENYIIFYVGYWGMGTYFFVFRKYELCIFRCYKFSKHKFHCFLVDESIDFTVCYIVYCIRKNYQHIFGGTFMIAVWAQSKIILLI